MIMVRAKFKVSGISKNPDDGTDAANCAVINLVPVFGDENPENKEFYKWTPGGQISLSLVSPQTAAQFVEGQSYYVDFTPVE